MCNLMCYEIMSHKEMLTQNFDCGLYDVSGCSLKEYPQNFNKAKGIQNLSKSKI